MSSSVAVDCAYKIRVLIADDHPFFRQGLRSALETEEDILVIGDAEDGAQAVALAKRHDVDVALLDIQLPVMDGFSAARSIHRYSPRTAVVFLTGFDGDEQLYNAYRASAAGLYLKHVDPQIIMDGIRRVFRGENPLDDEIARRPDLMARLNKLPAIQLDHDETDDGACPLSPRELEVIKYIAQGKTNRDIGMALCISNQTVKNHVANILRKLGICDRTQAVVLALKNGWITN